MIMTENFSANYSLIIEKLERILSQLSIPSSWSIVVRDLIMIALLVIVCVISFFIAKFIVKRVISVIISKTKNDWDDKLFSNKFFNRLAYVIPASIIVYLIPFTIPYYPGWILFITAVANIYIALIVLLAIFSLLNSFSDIYDEWEIAKYKPIKGYLQLIKIILSCIVAIIIIAIVFNQSPLYLLTGLGALSAVLLLVFKDTLLGLVAGIQLSANDMARPGDWITMPKFNADGDVEEITLTTVKVRNFDRTSVYIPAYAMISDSFTNWRGMLESEGRRIKRAIHIDMNSVDFCNNQTLSKLKKIALVNEYIETKQKEIDEYNNAIPSDTSFAVNGRRQTNLGIFRAYMEAYLRASEKINQDTILMVRQLAPTDKGIPLEVYAFSVSKEWVVYEQVQSDIFDHFIAALPHFNLKLYQTPSGGDVHSFISHSLSPESKLES